MNESLAMQLFGRRSPVGRPLWIGKTSYDIVGVVSDYATNPVESRTISPKVFVPLSTEPKDVPFVRLLIRADRDPVAARAAGAPRRCATPPSGIVGHERVHAATDDDRARSGDARSALRRCFR